MLTFYRNRLRSPQARAIYDRMARSLSEGNVSGVFRMTCPVPGTAHQDGFDAARALRLDRPEWFFLGHRVEAELTGTSLVLRCEILYSPAEIRRMGTQLELTLRRLAQDTAGLGEWDRERIVYERTARMLTYENHGTDAGSCSFDHNAIGPALGGSGVCEGFACLLVLALRQVGIRCIRVNGTCRGGPHAWNIAWINGSACQLDVTADSCEQGRSGFFYFNRTDAEMARSHKLGEAGMPRCTDPDLNYHRRNRLEFPSVSQASEFFDRFFHSGGKICTVRFPQSDHLSETVRQALRSCPTMGFQFLSCTENGSALVWVRQKAS